MGDPIKRKIPATDSGNRLKRFAKAPNVATTKATMARAAAIKSNNNQSTASDNRALPLAARPSTASTVNGTRNHLEGKANSAKTTTVNTKEAKKRPSWDIRGRMNDMEDQLRKDRDKIGKLETYRDGLMSTVQDKDSEITKNIQQITEVKADIQLKERRYQQAVVDSKAQYQGRIQKLEDAQRSCKGQIDELEMDLSDANRKLQNVESKADKELNDNTMLKKTIADSAAAFKEVESQILALKLKLTRADDTLASREQLIQKLEGELETETTVTDKLESKFEEETRNRLRLEATISELGTRTEQAIQSRKKTL